MIKEIQLRNFKCFSEQHIPMGSLNVLAGLNGMGKSTVIQSLLLLRQSYMAGCLQRGQLVLGGELTDLGKPSDILFEGAQEDRIELSLILGEPIQEIARFPFVITSDEGSLTSPEGLRDARAVDLVFKDENAGALFNPVVPELSHVSRFQYLNAERYGPRKSLPMSLSRAEAFDLGSRGEYVLHVLETHQDRILMGDADPRFRSEAASPRLRDQLEIWLNEISPGVRLNLTPVSEADLMISGFSFGGTGQLRSRPYRATNVGFGLSYVLPVLVALIATPQSGLLLIENPEAHMHPRGQTRLGELCARAAAVGVQLVIETHSDHVMDGVRIAIREGILAPDRAAFHYFGRDEGKITVVSPTVDYEGRLSSWPTGFFDQHRRNTARLIRPRN